MWVARVLRTITAIVIALLVGTLVSATLVRMAPGFDSDERVLDSRLSAESIAAIRAERAGNRNILHFYLTYVARAAHGDFGVSQSLDRPVSELIRDRLPTTIGLALGGLLLGWVAALGLAVSATVFRNVGFDISGTVVAGALLCIPSAVLALASALFRTPAYLAVALIVLPRVYRYCRNLLAHSYDMPHVLTARAKGLSEARVLFWHILPTSAPQLLALAGVSVSIAFGACIPIESLCGIAGVGQLAWQAALGRDLPLLVTITCFVTIVTLIANSGSDLLNQGTARPQEG
jgi:peptide/nickel transport system permease protein